MTWCMSSIPVRLSAAVAYVRTAWAVSRPAAAANFWQLLAVIFLLSPSEMKDLEVMMPRYDSHLGVGDQGDVG